MLTCLTNTRCSVSEANYSQSVLFFSMTDPLSSNKKNEPLSLDTSFEAPTDEISSVHYRDYEESQQPLIKRHCARLSKEDDAVNELDVLSNTISNVNNDIILSSSTHLQFTVSSISPPSFPEPSRSVSSRSVSSNEEVQHQSSISPQDTMPSAGSTTSAEEESALSELDVSIPTLRLTQSQKRAIHVPLPNHLIGNIQSTMCNNETKGVARLPNCETLFPITVKRSKPGKLRAFFSKPTLQLLNSVMMKSIDNYCRQGSNSSSNPPFSLYQNSQSPVASVLTDQSHKLLLDKDCNNSLHQALRGTKLDLCFDVCAAASLAIEVRNSDAKSTPEQPESNSLPVLVVLKQFVLFRITKTEEQHLTSSTTKTYMLLMKARGGDKNPCNCQIRSADGQVKLSDSIQKCLKSNAVSVMKELPAETERQARQLALSELRRAVKKMAKESAPQSKSRSTSSTSSASNTVVAALPIIMGIPFHHNLPTNCLQPLHISPVAYQCSLEIERLISKSLTLHTKNSDLDTDFELRFCNGQIETKNTLKILNHIIPLYDMYTPEHILLFRAAILGAIGLIYQLHLGNARLSRQAFESSLETLNRVREISLARYGQFYYGHFYAIIVRRLANAYRCCKMLEHAELWIQEAYRVTARAEKFERASVLIVDVKIKLDGAMRLKKPPKEGSIGIGSDLDSFRRRYSSWQKPMMEAARLCEQVLELMPAVFISRNAPLAPAQRVCHQRIRALNTLATIHRELNAVEKAFEYHQKARDNSTSNWNVISQPNNKSLHYAILLTNHAFTFSHQVFATPSQELQQQSQYNPEFVALQAISLVNEAISIFHQLGSHESEFINSNYVNAYKTGQFVWERMIEKKFAVCENKLEVIAPHLGKVVSDWVCRKRVKAWLISQCQSNTTWKLGFQHYVLQEPFRRPLQQPVYKALQQA